MQSRVVTERRKDKSGKVIEHKKVVFGGKELDRIQKAEILPLSDEEKLEVTELQVKLKVGMPTKLEMSSGETTGRDRTAVKKLLQWEKDQMSNIVRYQHLRERDTSIQSINSLRD